MVQQCLNDSEREFFAEVSTCFTPDQPALHRADRLYTESVNLLYTGSKARRAAACRFQAQDRASRIETSM
jgi:hypothetical protein